MSLERGSTGGCVGACPFTTVTFYRSTVSGIAMPAPCRTAPCPSGSGEVRGRAELRTVEGVSDALTSPRATRISEGSVRLREFANLSYLLHKLQFLALPDVYHCVSCPADRVCATVTVVAGGKAKAVTDYGLERPVELWAIQQAFDSVSTRTQWTQK
jgi:hypothetical protein